MRSGELAGLQWADVHFNGRYLMVKRQVVWGKAQTTKGNNQRRIDISTALLDALMELKRERQEEWLAKGKNEIPPWVFCNQEGNPLDMNNVKNRHFYKCLEKAGLRRMRFHDLSYVLSQIMFLVSTSGFLFSSLVFYRN
jgi:integrase